MKKEMMVLLVICVSFCRAGFDDDFESYNTGMVRNVASPTWTAVTNTGSTHIVDDGTGNKVLNYGLSLLRGVFTNKFDPIADNTENNLLFFNFYINAERVNHGFGLTDKAGNVNTGFYMNDYEVQLFMQEGTPNDGKINFGVQDGGVLLNTEVDINKWYNVWALIDQVNDSYDVYLSSGEADISYATLIADNASFKHSSSGQVGDLVTLLGLGLAADGNGVWIDNVSLGEYVCTVPAPGALVLAAFGTAFVGRIRRMM